MGIPVLNITSRTTLRRLVSESAVFFEDNAAGLVSAEDKKLSKVAAAVASGFLPSSAITAVSVLIHTTRDAVSVLEQAIMGKAAGGSQLREGW